MGGGRGAPKVEKEEKRLGRGPNRVVEVTEAVNWERVEEAGGNSSLGGVFWLGSVSKLSRRSRHEDKQLEADRGEEEVVEWLPEREPIRAPLMISTCQPPTAASPPSTPQMKPQKSRFSLLDIS